MGFSRSSETLGETLSFSSVKYKHFPVVSTILFSAVVCFVQRSLVGKIDVKVGGVVVFEKLVGFWLVGRLGTLE